MKISIITPYRKGTDYLRDCLESISCQSFRVPVDGLKGIPGFEGITELLNAEERGDAAAAESLMAIMGEAGADELARLVGTPGFEGLSELKSYADVSFIYDSDADADEDRDEERSDEEETDQSGEDEVGLSGEAKSDQSGEDEVGLSGEAKPDQFGEEETLGEKGKTGRTLFRSASKRNADPNADIDICGIKRGSISERYICVPFTDYEMILVLDHPDEDPQKVINEYKDRMNLKTVSLADTTGTAAARNAGIAASSGDYIFFVDSDDYLYSGALYFISRSIVNGESPDVIFGKKIWTWYTRTGYLSQREKKLVSRRAKLQKLLFRENGESDEASNEASGETSEDGSASDASDELDREDASDLAEEDDSAGDDDAGEGGDSNKGFDDTVSDIDEAEGITLLSEDELALLEQQRAERKLERARKRVVKRLIVKRKGLRNVSVLNIAFKRELIDRENLRFVEQLRYYSDLQFLALALEKAGSFRKNYKARYIKRKHGDPINFPSLAQEKSPERFGQFVKAYVMTRDSLPEGSIIADAINRKFIHYYTRFFVTRVRRSRNDSWRTDRFETVRQAFEGIPAEFIAGFSHYSRKLIKELKRSDVKAVYRTVTHHLAIKKLKKCIKNKAVLRDTLYRHIFLKLPIRDDFMMFECFFGKSYGDNPKGIYEYMAKEQAGKYKLIWSMGSVKRGRQIIPFRHTTVKRQSIRYAYYVARSRYFVYNTKQPKWMQKREGQIFLETWHGTPLKKLAFDMEDNFSAAPGYKKEIYGMTRGWDYLVSANSFSSKVFRSCFVFDRTMLEFGYPRNDILHRPDRDELAASIKEKLGIPQDKKTILYAPTWRDDEYYAAGKYKFSLKLNLKMLREALDDQYVILLRTHYYIADKLDISGMEGFAYNLSKYPDIADIYLISDMCITDYSSVFFDYANLRRPMLFYTYDLDNYRDILRGFYFDMESTVPGPLLFTTEQVIDAIENIDEVNKKFAKRYDEFYDTFCGWEDGHASENIAKTVFRL